MLLQTFTAYEGLGPGEVLLSISKVLQRLRVLDDEDQDQRGRGHGHVEKVGRGTPCLGFFYFLPQFDFES
jgi:hypothetical protein